MLHPHRTGDGTDQDLADVGARGPPHAAADRHGSTIDDDCHHGLPRTHVRHPVLQRWPKEIGVGFNNATANLYLGAQLAPGIRVALTSYLSSRHHNETWVKDGYLLIDQSPIEFLPFQFIMAMTTLKLGHFEVNYGDAHFRRSDNGNAMYNPFVGNLILDAFTTEIGGEALFRVGPFLAMGGITGGEIRGNVTRPDDRSLAFLGKVGFDPTGDAARCAGELWRSASAAPGLSGRVTPS